MNKLIFDNVVARTGDTIIPKGFQVPAVENKINIPDKGQVEIIRID